VDDLAEIKAQKPREARSLVRATLAAHPDVAARHFQAKLEVETDPSDVHSDLLAGHDGLVVVDARVTEAYKRAHVPGAISMPYRDINPASASPFSKDNVVVVYCWGPGCNAAAKAGLRFAELGFRVKEMIGGIEYWRREGYPLASGDEQGSLAQPA
jgi:rhodanese-related sulfurtransferase